VARLAGAGRFGSSRRCAGTLPQPQASKVRAAERRALAEASDRFMISAMTSIAALVWTRASSLTSTKVSVSSVIIMEKL